MTARYQSTPLNFCNRTRDVRRVEARDTGNPDRTSHLQNTLHVTKRLFLKNQQNALDFLVLIPHHRRLLVHPHHVLPLNQNQNPDQMNTDRKRRKMVYRKSTLIHSLKRREVAQRLSVRFFSLFLFFIPLWPGSHLVQGVGTRCRTRNGVILVAFRTCPTGTGTSTGAHKICQPADH
jgi:hypothetical protein